MRKLLFVLMAALVLTSCGKDGNEPEVVYTVTFNADGGTPAPQSQTVKSGEKATAPASPTKQGYVFLFWHLSGSTTAYNFATPLTGNITLQAKWESEAVAEYWQVTWELNSGAWPASGDNHATQVVKGGTLAEPTPPTKTGQVFDGWYREAALTNKINFPYSVSAVTANITLYAKWVDPAAEYWNITWELNGGAWPSTGDNHLDKVEKVTTLAQPAAPTKAGNTFDGWYKEAEFTNKITFPAAVTGDIKLYAKWTAEKPSDEKTVVSGRYHYFALENGILYALGSNKYGQLGTDRSDMEILTQITTGVAGVYTGGYSTFIIKSDGSVYGSGLNDLGQLGLGDENNRNGFTSISLTGAKSMSVGFEHSLLLKNNGSVSATGRNRYGELGIGHSMKRTNFTATNLTSDIVAVSAGFMHSLALKNDGTVWGTGNNGKGELGLNATDEVNTFVQIFSGAKAIAAGDGFSLILKNDGTVYASGTNMDGQSGIGQTEYVTTFTRVIDNSGMPLTGIVSISVGNDHSLALKADGSLWVTGKNDFGQLGTGDKNNRNKFTKTATEVKGMSAGISHTVMVKNDKTIMTYGKVNPYDIFNGSGTIMIKSDDPYYHQYIKSFWLDDNNGTRLLSVNENIASYKVTIKPGVYNMGFYVSNSLVLSEFKNLTVGDNETVTITYECYSSVWPGSYRLAVTRSK